jgi:peptide/nickel transport system permease protein
MRRIAGFVLLAPMLAFALCGPLLVQVDPLRQDLMAALSPPGADWLLGTDDLGRSVLARAVHAAGTSLGLAAACVVLAWGGGVALGLLAAWRGGWAAALVLRGADTVMAFPALLLTLLIAGLLGGGAAPLVLGVALAQLAPATRMAHALAAGAVALPYVQAARLAGLGTPVILAKDVLPPLLPQLLTQAAMAVAHAVLTIAGLGFLGIGLPPPVPEWGMMIAEAAPFLTEAPWAVMAPACLLVATVLGLTLLAREPA